MGYALCSGSRRRYYIAGCCLVDRRQLFMSQYRTLWCSCETRRNKAVGSLHSSARSDGRTVYRSYCSISLCLSCGVITLNFHNFIFIPALASVLHCAVPNRRYTVLVLLRRSGSCAWTIDDALWFRAGTRLHMP
jgi:hypothetical protein